MTAVATLLAGIQEQSRGYHGQFTKTATVCTVDDCEREPRRNGMCNMHELGVKRNGHADLVRAITPDKVRFWRSVGPSGECWEWQGARVKGYGKFTLNPGRKSVLAHRFAYEHMVAELPEGIALDHLCLNKACVNPSHLDPVTAAINTTRHYQRQEPAAMCKRGHDLPPVVEPGKKRHCKECRNANERAKRKERALSGS